MIFSVLQPTAFLSWFNLKNIAINASPILLMAVGETFVLSASGLDLSVGSVLVLTSVLAVRGFEFAGSQGWAAVILGFVIAIVSGLFIGLINGVLIAKYRIPALVVTLAMSFAAQGIGYVITGGNDLKDVPDELVNSIGYSSILNIPDLVWISFVVALIGSFVYYTTRFGRYTVVLGSNPEAAVRAGIRVDRHIIKIYAICGVTAGLAGFLSLAQYSGTQIGGHSQDFLLCDPGGHPWRNQLLWRCRQHAGNLYCDLCALGAELWFRRRGHRSLLATYRAGRCLCGRRLSGCLAAASERGGETLT